jgi:hypothetical protein
MILFFGDATVPMSGDWSNPAVWADFIVKNGVPIFVLVLILVPAFFIAYKIAKWLFGNDGWLKASVEGFFNNILEGQTAQRTMCQSVENKQISSIGCLHEAAHTGVELLREIGHGVPRADKARIDDLTETVHRTLRGSEKYAADVPKVEPTPAVQI